MTNLTLPKCLIAAIALGNGALLAAPNTNSSILSKTPQNPLSESVLTVQLQGSPAGAAFGGSILVPLINRGNTSFFAEGYGLEGEQSFGEIGGGLGVRTRLGHYGTLGLNTFFEGLETHRGISYPQVGFGLEYGVGWFALRSNFYLPLSGAESLPPETSFKSDCHCCTKTVQTEEAPATGWDIDAEFALPKHPRWIDPRLLVGYYQRFHNSWTDESSGVKIGAEIHLPAHFTLLAEWRQDAANIKEDWVVGARIEIPLGNIKSLVEPSSTSGSKMVASNLGEELFHIPVRRNPWPSALHKTTTSETECSSGVTPLIFE